MRNSNVAGPHYYSDRLRGKMNRLRTAAFTVVEAPSGYGKTTAISDYLEKALPQGTPVFWVTAEDEAHVDDFRRLCSEINKIDRNAGRRLRKIEYPDCATVGEACEVLRSIVCSNETYLVIDNFQYMLPTLPKSFLEAMTEHGGKSLHIIVISQTLTRDMMTVVASHGVFHLSASDLRLEMEDIRNYYSLWGRDISVGNANEIARYTEGWIAAVYLQLCAYMNEGQLAVTSGIYSLMEQLVWNGLTIEQQTFLMRLSLFSTVTVRQACLLCGWNRMPEYAQEALLSSFIHFDYKRQYYELHNILSELLIQKKREKGEAFQRECLLMAGDCRRDEGDIIRAIDFYAQAGEYERILQFDLSTVYFETVGGIPFFELALQIAEKCTAEVKQRFLLPMLQVAYALLTAGMNEEFCNLLDELYPMLDKSDAEVPVILGEWMLLSSFKYLPKLDEMIALLKSAYKVFNGKCSRVITSDSPWCYSIFAPFFVFHTVPGEAEREADTLEEYITLYSELTNGHGSGADVLFRVELAHHRGDLLKAEIFAHKALFIAQSRQQKVIQLAATLHLGEIAVESGDASGWRHAVDSLSNSPGALKRIFTLPSAVDTAQGMLLSELGKDEEVAEWLRCGDFYGRQLPSMKSSRMLIHLDALLHQRKYAQLIETAEYVYPEDYQMHSFHNVYHALMTAVGYLCSGNRGKASEYAKCAVREVIMDGLYCQLLYYGSMLEGLIEECIERDFPEHQSHFEMVKRRSMQACVFNKSSLSTNYPDGDLTARELEVAQLAADGLHNSEIAEKLGVTENTVRFHLRAVFQKLNIDRRTKLAEKLKQ